MNHPSNHLDPERIQVFLDDQLSTAESKGIRVHLESCPRCRTELEVWKGVFARLEGLAEFSPAMGFRQRVLATAQLKRPLPHRLLATLRRMAGSRAGERRHLPRTLLLEYLDRSLGARKLARVETHLEACGACWSEMAEWKGLFGKLEALPHSEPSPAFAERVLARVHTPGRESAPERVAGTSPTRTGRAATKHAGGVTAAADRIAGWWEKLRPRKAGGWALAGGMTVAPAAALAAGVIALFSHPLVTPASLTTFLWWQATESAQAFFSGIVETALASPLIFSLWSGVQEVIGEPVLILSSGLGFSAATAAALWILYQNLNPARVGYRTPAADRGYTNV